MKACGKDDGKGYKPLKEMGANIWAKDNDTKAPISIKGASLKGINYNSPVSSAQIKSCILLAGLHAEGTTIVTEPVKSRDHSERMLSYLHADIKNRHRFLLIQLIKLILKMLIPDLPLK